MLALSRLKTAGQRLMPKIRQLSNRQSSTQVQKIDYENHWNYRRPHFQHTKKTLLKANILGTVLWYWLLHHLWYNWGDVVGHHPYPDPSKWTNKELGIPPDDLD